MAVLCLLKGRRDLAVAKDAESEDGDAEFFTSLLRFYLLRTHRQHRSARGHRCNTNARVAQEITARFGKVCRFCIFHKVSVACKLRHIQ